MKCIDCKFYEDNKCHNSFGILKNISITESMSLAEHDCQYCEEIKYKLTATGALYAVLCDYGIQVPLNQIKAICDDYFEKLMKLGILCSD